MYRGKVKNTKKIHDKRITAMNKNTDIYGS